MHLDFDTVHKPFIKADPCFNSIPISSSGESQNLRITHAQRVISSSLCKTIWQPFSSEKTLPHPEFVSLVSQISAELAKSSYGGSSSGRAASVWTALTRRALESLSLASPSRPTLTSQETITPAPPSGADKVINDVLSVLSPRVTLSQEPHLRNELVALAHSAISVWTFAQTAELKILIRSRVDRASRNEWRSLIFDPLLSRRGCLQIHRVRL